MALTRKTKNTQSQSAKRKIQSPMTRKTRLQKNKKYRVLYYSQLSPQKKREIISANNQRRYPQHSQESEVEKKNRLEKKRTYAAAMRNNESELCREVRLDQLRDTASLNRLNESPATHQERLIFMRNYISRRRLYSDDSSFYNKINQVTDMDCYVCGKLLFQSQSRSIDTRDTIIPDEKPERIICCNRCANHVTKHKTPPMALWNKMKVSPIPEELGNLNEMEIRLVSRIRPFIKVVRLGGRFGQQGFKGQAILFAQQIEEVAEQLPISLANTGLTIVTESLENVAKTNRYCIDLDKVQKALEWLIANNHLYANVRVDLNRTRTEMNRGGIETIVTQEEPLRLAQNQNDENKDPRSFFKIIDKDRSILRGTFHQASIRFNESRGRQCIANATTAIAYSADKPLCEWSSEDLDRVLLAGNTYFLECVSRLKNVPDILNTEELLDTVSIANVQHNLEIDIDVIVGLINPLLPSELLPGYYKDLESGVDFFYKCHDHGIITCETNISVAILKVKGYYYLFDSHSRGPKGFIASDKGTSMLMKFSTCALLCKHLHIVLGIRNQKDLQYSITSIKTISNLPSRPIANGDQRFFRALNNEKSILRGTFHQASERFNESRGRQCTANAATAIAYSFEKPLFEWSSEDMDRILLAGNKYFLSCLSRLDYVPDMLNTEELIQTVTVENVQHHLEIIVDTVIGVINPLLPSEILPEYYIDLESGVDFFFKNHERGIVTCQTNIAVAIMKVDGYYYLFDSHSRGPEGFMAEDLGASMLMKFSTCVQLCNHLDFVLGVHSQRDLQYSLTAIKVTRTLDLSNRPHINTVESQTSLRMSSTDNATSPIKLIYNNMDDMCSPTFTCQSKLEDSVTRTHDLSNSHHINTAETQTSLQMSSTDNATSPIKLIYNNVDDMCSPTFTCQSELEDSVTRTPDLSNSHHINTTETQTSLKMFSTDNATSPIKLIYNNVDDMCSPTFTCQSECRGSDIFQGVREGEIVTTGLMLIDTLVPNMNDVIVNQVNANETIPIYELKRKTAPPISIFTEQRAEELAWVRLFPDGRNGFRELRQVPITPLDYYQARVMSNERRFQSNEYLFYALSTVEIFKAQQNVSVCARLRQDGAEVREVLQNVHLVMKNIRGTQSYWHNAYTDLLAMVKNLGPPHWYITLSCNDLNWSDILKALLVADGQPNLSIENLSFEEKLRLVESYPVTLCRQFMFRFQTFLKHLKQRDDPILGKPVIDLWWRIEFQLRGSPHVHMVVWCEDMPLFDTPEGVQMLDQVVTCELPDDDQELKNLVHRLQIHKHTHTCLKNGNICRFGFPRPAAQVTQILDDDQSLRNNGRFYVLKRKDAETLINNYNARILKMWQANIDIQPCCSAMGIAYYISKYISKSEPTEVSQAIRDAIRRVQEKGGNFNKQIFAVQSAILTHRQVSACECAFRLCHLKLRDSSRKCVFVNSCKPELRYRMLQCVSSEQSEPFKNIFDRYVSRPRNLDNLSIGEFAVWFEPVRFTESTDDDQDLDAYEENEEDLNTAPVQGQFITLLDNMGRMKKRSRPAILRTRYFTAASDPEAYYYSLLVTHIPFRDEAELTEGFETAKDAFFYKKHLLRPVQDNYDAETMCRWENEIQNAISRIVAENMASEINSNHPQGEETEEVHPFLADEAQILIHEVEDYTDIYDGMTDQQYESAVSSLNLQQRQLFKKVSNKLLSNTLERVPLRVFITGGAGTGKTFTLKLIVEQILRLSQRDGHKAVAVTAPTGVAARLIGGSTIHSTFALPIEKGKPEPLRPMTGERLERERQKWRYINWLIIDEVSMVPYLSLRNIHLRLQQLKSNQEPFGNVNILLFGDLMQLPPVSKTTGGAYCFRQPQTLSGEVNLWQLFDFCELPQNMRQAGETTFIDILNSLRIGELTMQQLEVLDSRRIPLIGQFDDGEAVRIFPTTKQVHSYNTGMTEELEKKIKIYKIDAVDTSLEARTYGQKPKQIFIPEDPNKTGGILSTIKIGKGSRVMLRRNININRGLVNGVMGVVREIEWPALRKDQLEVGELPSAVFVEFDDSTMKDNIPGIGLRIEPTAVEFDALRGQGKVERRMLPLILCWAVTIHKLQGTTLDRAVVDLSAHLFAKGQAYVALSRIRTLEGLAICALDPRRLLNNPHDLNSLQELNRLRSLEQTNMSQ